MLILSLHHTLNTELYIEDIRSIENDHNLLNPANILLSIINYFVDCRTIKLN